MLEGHRLLQGCLELLGIAWKLETRRRCGSAPDVQAEPEHQVDPEPCGSWIPHVAWDELTLDRGPDLIIRVDLGLERNVDVSVHELDIRTRLIGVSCLRLHGDTGWQKERPDPFHQSVTAIVFGTWLHGLPVRIDIPEDLVAVGRAISNLFSQALGADHR